MMRLITKKRTNDRRHIFSERGRLLRNLKAIVQRPHFAGEISNLRTGHVDPSKNNSSVAQKKKKDLSFNRRAVRHEKH